MQDITDFVEFHVELMLQCLYVKLKQEEENLATKLEFPSKLDQSRRWLKGLMFNDPKAQNVGSLRGQLFGPVGERPLHVCSLSAHRFGDIEVLGQGNYMRDGIINGMKRYLAQGHWGEAYVEYGKDYCALLSDCFDSLPPTWEHRQEPPFWCALTEQFEHCHQRTIIDSAGRPASRKMVWDEKKKLFTLGLYEGETIAYPMIASGDDLSLYWILEAEKRKAEETKEQGMDGHMRGKGNDGRPTRWSFACYVRTRVPCLTAWWVLTAWFSNR
jgi:hypothetical protein